MRKRLTEEKAAKQQKDGGRSGSRVGFLSSGPPRGASAGRGPGPALTVFAAVVGRDLGRPAVPPCLVVLVEAADRHPQTVAGQHQEHMVQGSGKFFQLHRCGERAQASLAP